MRTNVQAGVFYDNDELAKENVESWDNEKAHYLGMQRSAPDPKLAHPSFSIAKS